MTEQSECGWLYLFSSNARPEYITDTLEVLASPNGFVHHFRYDEKWTESSLWKKFPEEERPPDNPLVDAKVVICYLFQLETSKGTWKSVAVYPIRRGRVVDAYRTGGVAHIHFQVEDYYKCDPLGSEGVKPLQDAIDAALDSRGPDWGHYAVLGKPFDINPAPAPEAGAAFQSLVNAIPQDHFKTVRFGCVERPYCATFYRVHGLFRVGRPPLVKRVWCALRRQEYAERLVPLEFSIDRTFRQVFYRLTESTRYALAFSTYHADANPVLELRPSIELDYDEGIFVRPPNDSLTVSSRYDSELWSVIPRSTKHELSTALTLTSNVTGSQQNIEFLSTVLTIPLRLAPRFWHRRSWALVYFLGDVGLAAVALGIALNRIGGGASWLWLIVLGSGLTLLAKVVPKLVRGDE